MVSDAFCYVISLSDLHLYPICCIIEVVCRFSLLYWFYIRAVTLLEINAWCFTCSNCWQSAELRVLEFTKMAHDLHSVIQWRQLGPPSPSSPPPPIHKKGGEREDGVVSQLSFVKASWMVPSGTAECNIAHFIRKCCVTLSSLVDVIRWRV